jgi:cytochrome c biogenesis protein CcmG, thiol:disulfide interchange protein DsbE
MALPLSLSGPSCAWNALARRRVLRALATTGGVALAGTAMLGVTTAHAVAVVGDRAPDIVLPECAVAQRLSDLRGRLVYLDFWASWCTPCRLSFPWMGEMQKRHGGRGLQVVAVNLDVRRADADAFLARHPSGIAVAFDPRGVSAEAFGVRAMPTSVLIDPDQRVLAVHRGFRLEDAAALEAKVVAALPSR